MAHHASARFWAAYRRLPVEVQTLANRCFALLEENPHHPSLQLKKVGKLWSARIGLRYRAVAVEIDDGLLWTWIGTHREYDRLIGG